MTTTASTLPPEVNDVDLMPPKVKCVSFKELAIGEEFSDGHSKGSGATQNVWHWEVYRKTDKSHAVCISQVNYRNSHRVGNVDPFHSMNKCFQLLPEAQWIQK
jgi:hypothetical protein